jgi:hypothetical protein
MIGLLFLGVVCLWVFLAVKLTKQIPRLLGMTKYIWLLQTVFLLILLVGPFVDHIIGMRQFQKLCNEQTSLHIYSNAADAKRVKEEFSVSQLLDGYIISIEQRTDSVVDLDTNELIAKYNHFSTSGGRIGGLVRIGNSYECAVFQSTHPEVSKYLGLRKQIELKLGMQK